MSIKKQAITGVKWTSLSTAFIALSAILKVSILARYLDKADFGLMALVMFVLGFMNLFMDMGLTTAILHKKGITKKEYASLYWLNLCISVLIFGVVYLITPLVSAFYGEKELLNLLPLMGLSLILFAIGQQFKTIQQKELKFKTISIIDVFSSFMSLGLASYLAINNYGVYSLVYSSLFQYLVANLLFLMLGISNVGLMMYYKFTDTKPFLKIGIYQVGGQIVNYFNRDFDILIIGKIFGPDILGGYSLAKQLVFRPVQLTNPVLTRVASPVLAKFQSNIKLLRESYLKLVNIVSSINTPIYIGCIIFAPIIVRIFYGEGYENIVTIVRILSVRMIFRSIANPMGSLIIATGRTDLGMAWNLMILPTVPIAVLIGAQFSIEWVAGSITISTILLFIPSWWFMIRKMSGAKFKDYVLSIIPFKKINIANLFKK